MMKGNKGLALVFLLLSTMVLFLLGLGLFTVALIDYRISHHLSDWEQAFYSAEAGVAMALAMLPQDPEGLWGYEGSFSREGMPAFTAEVSSEEDGKSVLIEAIGFARGKERRVRVVAAFRPFGGFGLIGEEVVLDEVDVYGHVKAGDVSFIHGESHVTGDLCCFSVGSAWGGSYLLGGWQRELVGEGYPLLDFVGLEEQVVEDGWALVEAEASGYVLEGEVEEALRLFVRGDLVIGETFRGRGIVAVSGDVEILCIGVEEELVVLAGGDVTVLGNRELEERGSVFLYSGGKLLWEDCEEKEVNGVFVGSRVELSGVELHYCDLAALEYFTDLPGELLEICPSFALRWEDTGHRR
jgi:hypothetical protein